MQLLYIEHPIPGALNFYPKEATLCRVNIRNSNDKYRKVVYRCNRKYRKGMTPCSTPTLTENEIK